MGFFRKLVKNVKDQAMRDQSVSIERLPTEPKGIGSMLGGTTRRKRKKNPNLEAFYNSPAYKDFQDSGGTGTMDMYTASDGSIFSSGSVGRMYEKFLKDQAASKSPPAPTGIEALIRPPRTDPGNQEDMRKLMDMQKQTFRSFLAPPPPDVVSQPYFPVDGGDLGIPRAGGPGTPMPPGTIFEGEVGGTPINIQDIIDNLPKGVGVGGIGSIPVSDIPYEIPQITAPADFVMPSLPVDLPLQLPQIENIGIPAIQLPFEIPSLPQVAMMPSVSPVAMPAMRMARATPSMAGMRER